MECNIQIRVCLLVAVLASLTGNTGILLLLFYCSFKASIVLVCRVNGSSVLITIKTYMFMKYKDFFLEKIGAKSY